MKKNNLIRFVESLIFLPVVTLSFGNVHNTEILQNRLAQQLNIGVYGIPALNKADLSNTEALKAKAEAIDAYFAKYDMPLEGTGMKMVQEALKNNLDWRLLPAIAVRESTGGKFACKNNAFGWGSCKINFKSNGEAIETVARNLSGNDPKTSSYYKNKTTTQILRVYNPPSIVPKYAQQVISIMDTIGDADATPTLAIASA